MCGLFPLVTVCLPSSVFNHKLITNFFLVAIFSFFSRLNFFPRTVDLHCARFIFACVIISRKKTQKKGIYKNQHKTRNDHNKNLEKNKSCMCLALCKYRIALNEKTVNDIKEQKHYFVWKKVKSELNKFELEKPFFLSKNRGEIKLIQTLISIGTIPINDK